MRFELYPKGGQGQIVGGLLLILLLLFVLFRDVGDIWKWVADGNLNSFMKGR